MIAVNELIIDPDFSTTAEIIRRTWGMIDGINVITNALPQTITCVIQPGGGELLQRRLEAGLPVDYITVWTREQIFVGDQDGNYSDLIVWQGRTYQASEILRDANLHGYYKTLCTVILQ